MYDKKIIFAQIMEYLPREVFDQCVKQYNGNFNEKGFTCRDQFLAMAFAQLTTQNGLRGIQNTLNANHHCLYHMGFRCDTISKSTLAHANKNRPWQIYATLAQTLMKQAQAKYQNEPLPIDFDATVFAFDSTTIDLCLTRFRWAATWHKKAGIKLHTLLNLRGNIPCFIVISDAKAHDVNFLDALEYEAGAYYIFDRGYVDFDRLYALHMSRAFYVIRAKRRMCFRAIESFSVDKNLGVRCDQRIRFERSRSHDQYPDFVRRIKYYDSETNRVFVFLTNDFSLPAVMVAKLYKQRWQVELFFKWVKQHLKVKEFYGHSVNALKTQIWIAVSVYCLLLIIQKELCGDRSLHEIQEILSVSIFQKMPILQAFSSDLRSLPKQPSCKPLSLFEI